MYNLFNNFKYSLNIQFSICQLYHGENKLHFDETMLSTFYQTKMSNWIFIVLGHGQTCCFTPTNYYVVKPTSFCSYFLLLCDQQRSSKYIYNTNYIVIGLTQLGLESMIYHTLRRAYPPLHPPWMWGNKNKQYGSLTDLYYISSCQYKPVKQSCSIETKIDVYL